jgi:hypothetical protein
MNAAPAYYVMLRLLRGDLAAAARAMLLWAVCSLLGGTLTMALWPVSLDSLVWHGPAYRDEMLAWIRTGAGSESRLSLFLTQHILHLAVFIALCLVSAGAIGILLGAVLMNYMSFYVAALYRLGWPLWAVVCLGWQPWALCRVAGFCLLGVVLATPLLTRMRFVQCKDQTLKRRLLLWGAAGILCDWILKAILAPHWERLLRSLLPH